MTPTSDIGILAVSLLSLVVLFVRYTLKELDANKKEIRDLQRRIDLLEGQNMVLVGEKQVLQGELDRSRAIIREQESTIVRLTGEKLDLQGQIDRLMGLSNNASST